MHWDVLCWLVRLFNIEKGPVEGERCPGERGEGIPIGGFLGPQFFLGVNDFACPRLLSGMKKTERLRQ